MTTPPQETTLPEPARKVRKKAKKVARKVAGKAADTVTAPAREATGPSVTASASSGEQQAVRIITANIKDNPDMPDRWVRADVREVASLGGWLLFQEIGERADHLAIEDILGSQWRIRFPTLAVPIAVRDWATIKGEGFLKLHGGKAHVSPARYLAWLDLATPGRLDPILMNTHYVSGAWSSPAKPEQAWRRKMWNQSWEKTRAKIKEFNEQGRTVILGGDFNRSKVEPFTARWRWLAQHGIDKIGCSNPVAQPNITVTGTDHFDLHSDHDALRARVTWPT